MELSPTLTQPAPSETPTTARFLHVDVTGNSNNIICFLNSYNNTTTDILDSFNHSEPSCNVAGSSLLSLIQILTQQPSRQR